MKRAEKSRQSILKSAYLLMLEKETVPSMRDIAARAHMGLGSVYYHFTGLDQIFIELDSLIYGHIEDVIKDKALDLDDPLLLFMAVETFSTLFCLSREVYVKLYKKQPLEAHFSEKRMTSLESMLDPLWERSDDYDIYHYLGLYLAFFAKMTNLSQNGQVNGSIYDGMERLFFSFFEDTLDLWDISDRFRIVKDLGETITRKELELPWIDSDDRGSIGSFG